MQDKDFTAAMERAVEKRGGDYRYPRFGEPGSGGYYTASGLSPTYRNEAGEATCLIGAALAEMGLILPDVSENRGAQAVLQGYGFGLKVAVAGRCAQMHQDQNERWDQSLAVYKAALELQEVNRAYSNPWGVHDLYFAAVAQVTGVKTVRTTRAAVNIALNDGGMSILTNYFEEVSQKAKAAAAQVQEHMAKFADAVPSATFHAVGVAKSESPTFVSFDTASVTGSLKDYAIGGLVSNMTFNPSSLAPEHFTVCGPVKVASLVS